MKAPIENDMPHSGESDLNKEPQEQNTFLYVGNRISIISPINGAIEFWVIEAWDLADEIIKLRNSLTDDVVEKTLYYVYSNMVK